MSEHKNLLEHRKKLIVERWKRTLAMFGPKRAIKEIDYDLCVIQTYVEDNKICYPELTTEEMTALYNILMQSKTELCGNNLKKTKQVVSFRLTDTARFKLESIASRQNETLTAVVERLIREYEVN